MYPSGCRAHYRVLGVGPYYVGAPKSFCTLGISLHWVGPGYIQFKYSTHAHVRVPYGHLSYNMSIS